MNKKTLFWGSFLLLAFGFLGVNGFLEWGLVEARGVVVLWDSWVLEVIEMEVCAFSISCQFMRY